MALNQGLSLDGDMKQAFIPNVTTRGKPGHCRHSQALFSKYLRWTNRLPSLAAKILL
jgi:hypothetical protein